MEEFLLFQEKPPNIKGFPRFHLWTNLWRVWITSLKKLKILVSAKFYVNRNSVL